MAINKPDYEKDVYVNLSTQELTERLAKAYRDGEFDKGQTIADVLKARKEWDDSMPLLKESDDLWKKYTELMEKRDEKGKGKKGKEKTARLEERDNAVKEFFKNDMKSYTEGIKDNSKKLVEAKDQQIDDLKNRLNSTLTTLPTAKEYLSLRRRKLISISDHFQKFQQDKENYPKNFLIYAMGLTSTSVFGTREKLKRGKIKLLWKWESDDIKNWLGVLEERIKINADDKAWTKALKMQIADQVVEAKKAHIEKERENVWLAA